ncbi:MAG: hypothetical protein KJ593_06355 [Candidatus Omnitrophica bacterium]|nr:hypothetical protein [Candidatus Omnitrophota bacterium]
MSVLLYGIVLFVIAFFIHLAIWKIRIPKNQTNVLFLIFLSILLVGILFLRTSSNQADIFARVLPLGYLKLCILFISLTLAYIVTYSGLEVDSPSLVMVMKVHEAGPNGLDENMLQQNMNDDVLVLPRLNDLLTAKMIYVGNGKYKLRATGALVAKLFVFYRKLLRLEKGG